MVMDSLIEKGKQFRRPIHHKSHVRDTIAVALSCGSAEPLIALVKFFRCSDVRF